MQRLITLAATLSLAAPIAALPTTASANDYPTQARVEYVLQCIKDYGGDSFKNRYGCVCMIDKIAERLTYADYDEAVTFDNMRTVPGERSGIFRDNKRGRELGNTLAEVRGEAASACLMTKPGAES